MTSLNLNHFLRLPLFKSGMMTLGKGVRASIYGFWWRDTNNHSVHNRQGVMNETAALIKHLRPGLMYGTFSKFSGRNGKTATSHQGAGLRWVYIPFLEEGMGWGLCQPGPQRWTWDLNVAQHTAVPCKPHPTPTCMCTRLPRGRWDGCLLGPL